MSISNQNNDRPDQLPLTSDSSAYRNNIKQNEPDHATLINRIAHLEDELYTLQETRLARLARALLLLRSPRPKVIAEVLLRPLVYKFQKGIRAVLDSPLADANISGELEVNGWAVSSGSSISQIAVFLDNTRLGEAQYAQPRLDVLAVNPWLPLRCGFTARFRFEPDTSGHGFKELIVRISDDKGQKKEFRRRIRFVPLETLPDSSNHEASDERVYQVWIADHEPGLTELVEQSARSQQLAYRPLISVITPVYNSDPSALVAMLNSVQNQSYDHWELCLADGSTDPAIPPILEEALRNEPRIRLVRLERNLGIAGNSNVALGLVVGEFCALLDHDDLLAPNALYEVALALNTQPETDLLYSDHDLLSEDGKRRFQPLFKPGWSPEIMLSANYLTHLTVIRTELIQEVGGFALGLDGAQDWDLFWRVLEKPRQIQHIAKILYHWRDSSRSTATDVTRKPQTRARQLKVIEHHLQRKLGREALAYIDSNGFIRVKWAVGGAPKVSIIIPTKDHLELLQPCVQSILEKTVYQNYEILIVDTGSTVPEVAKYYASLQNNSQVRRLEYPQPFNFSAVNNWAAHQSCGEMLLFLNNDTEVISPDWLEEMVRWGQLPEIGMVGAKLLHRDGRLQHAGVIVGMGGFAGHIFAGLEEGVITPYGYSEWYRNYSAVTAACALIRREVFEQVGGFSESFVLNGSDVALGLKLQQHGYRIVYNPYVRLYHLESATHQGRNLPTEDYSLSLKTYQPLLEAGDPYFNPNLSYWTTTPTLSRFGDLQPLEYAQQYVTQLTRNSGSNGENAFQPKSEQ